MYNEFHYIERNRKAKSDYIYENIHAKVTTPLDSKNIKKYLFSMSEVQQFLFELLANSYLEKYDGDRTYQNLDIKLLSFFKYILYMAARVFNNLRYKNRDFYHYNRVLKASIKDN